MLDITLADPAIAGESTLREFLTQLVWRDSADAELSEAAAQGKLGRFARHLANAGLPKRQRLGKSVSGSCALLVNLFSIDASNTLEHLTRETLLAVTSRASRSEMTNHVNALLDALETEKTPSPAVLASWLGVLSEGAAKIDPAVLLRFWRRSLELSRQFALTDFAGDADPTSVDAELRDEILLRAGIVFAPLSVAQEWLAVGRGRWRDRLTQSDDAAPWPKLAGSRWQAWLGSLVRTTTDASAYGVGLWKRRHRSVLKVLAANVAASLLPDGSLAGKGGTKESNLPLLVNLLRLTGWDEESFPFRSVRAVVRSRGALRRSESDGKSKAGRPAFQLDEGQVALLRDSWRSKATVACIDYANRDVDLDVSIDGERLLRGKWECSVSIDGRRLEVSQGWKCDCWASDRDVDFVELSTPLGDGVTLMRQFMLGRNDGLLVIAEAVRGVPPTASVSLQSTLPLEVGRVAEADGFTRELQVPLTKRQVRAFPLHLPWERTASASGQLRANDEGLVLSGMSAGSQCRVLLFDWGRRRGDDYADGGMLAVAEGGRHVSAADACAGRVRVGNRQWVYWHNLTPAAVPRTCLGHHCDNETIVGQFQESGEFDILLHVEAESPVDETEKLEKPA